MRRAEEYPIVPMDWYYGLFPLDTEGETILSIDRVVEIAHTLLNQTEATEDDLWYSPTLHWMHIIKAEQGTDGAWPAIVNARTGEPVGTARTRTPADYMERVNRHLQSSEFEQTVLFARKTAPSD